VDVLGGLSRRAGSTRRSWPRALAVLRLVRGGPWPSPSRALALLAIVAGALVVPFLVWPLAPVAQCRSSRVGAARVVARRLAGLVSTAAAGNAVPRERPVHAGRDVILLSGAGAHRAALLVALVGHLVLLVALWSLPRLPTTAGWAAILATTAVLAAPAPRGRTRRPRRALAAEKRRALRDRRASPPPSRPALARRPRWPSMSPPAWPALALVAVFFARSIARHASPANARRAAHGPGTALVLALPLAVRRGASRSRECAAGRAGRDADRDGAGRARVASLAAVDRGGRAGWSPRRARR